MQFLRLPRYFKTLLEPTAAERVRRQIGNRRTALRFRGLHFEQLEDRRLLAVFTVDTTADPAGPPGTVSLRQAITSANANSGPDTINFNIPTSDPGFNGEWWTIGLASRLPTLSDSGTTIDGFSQPAAGTNTPVGTGGTVGVDQVPFPKFQQPEIAIDANHPTNPNSEALIIGGNASNILIRGMAIYDAGLAASSDSDVAILSQGGTGVNRVIESMFIGVLPDGSDPGLDERNIGFGVRQLSGGQVTVTKSYVGFNGRGGLDAGITSNNVIFTYNEVFQNGWASNAHDGIDINGRDSIARYNLSRDNVNATLIPNGGSGTGIELGSQATPGTGNNIVENNTIFGNLSAGVSVRNGASLNTIRKNVIFDNQVGISVNTEAGSVANHTYRNRISQNSIYMNMGLGIDLQHQVTDAAQWVGSPDGGNDTEVTGQDHAGLDADNGSNDLQNYPIISSVLAFSGSTTIEGTLISTPLTTFTIEFFSTPDGTLFSMGDREGKDFIGSIQVTTDAAGMATFSHTSGAAVSDDDVITATATKFTDANTPWSTSEFSPAVAVAEITLQEKVTGGGWYNQPISGTPTPTTQDDRANFGFNAKYKKDNPVPQGVTNFRYRPDDLHFISTSYAPLSLIVTEISPGVHRATWRGLGNLNNDSGFGFRADVTDAGEPGTSDTFHIKIWRELDGDPFTEEPLIVYDNDPTSTGTVLGGGNIQVHMRPNALEGVAGSADGPVGSALTREIAESALTQAIVWWRNEGVDEASLAAIANTQVFVTNLPEPFLGVAANGIIGIDDSVTGSLLTVVTHELGHLLGFDHDHENPVMAATLGSSAPFAFEAGLGSAAAVSLPAVVGGDTGSAAAAAGRALDAAFSAWASGARMDLHSATRIHASAAAPFLVGAPVTMGAAGVPTLARVEASPSQSDGLGARTGGTSNDPPPVVWDKETEGERSSVQRPMPAETERESQNAIPGRRGDRREATQEEFEGWFLPVKPDDAVSLLAHMEWRQACDACFAETDWENEFAEPGSGLLAAGLDAAVALVYLAAVRNGEGRATLPRSQTSARRRLPDSVPWSTI